MTQLEAVLARLQAAYLEVALCETWLSLRSEREAERVAHALHAEQANERSLELGKAYAERD